MSDTRIEILPDPRAPNGGQAIMRLHSVWLLPPGATFSISHVDQLAAETDDWPEGEHVPIAVALQSSGIDVVIGPSIVDRIAPGTPVRISVPAVPIEQELLWPQIMSSLPAMGAHVLSTSEELIAALGAQRRQQPPSVVPSAAETLPALSRPPTAELAPPGGERSAAGASAPKDQSAPIDPATPQPSVLDQPAARWTLAHEPTGFEAWKAALSWAGAGAAVALLVMQLATSMRSEPQPLTNIAELVAITPAFRQMMSPLQTSPKGRSTAGVDLDAALQLADFELRASTSDIERREAQFWLRHALDQAVSGSRLGWLLSQLGSTYAAGTGSSSDLATARAAWQLGTALGDAGATCLLAELARQGRAGTIGDADLALLHKRAGELGGCRMIAPAGPKE